VGAARHTEEFVGTDAIKFCRIDDFSFSIAQPDLPADSPRGGALVACQHDGLDAAVVQFVHQLRQIAAHRVGEPHEAEPNKSLRLVRVRARASRPNFPIRGCKDAQPLCRHCSIEVIDLGTSLSGEHLASPVGAQLPRAARQHLRGAALDG
jgi:hypothetical protein